MFSLYICFFSGKDFLGLPMSVHSIQKLKYSTGDRSPINIGTEKIAVRMS